MKRNVKIGIAILLLLILCISQFSVVIAVTDTEFFKTNKEEISKEETLEMILDISKVKYDKFDFTLTSNLDMNNISISEDIKLDNYNNEIAISIDKSKVKLDKISFYYQIPESARVGTKIELIAKIFAEKELKQEMKPENNNALPENENGQMAKNETLTSSNSEESNQKQDDILSSENINSDPGYEEVESKEISIKIVEAKKYENSKTENTEKPNQNQKPEENDNINAIPSIEQNANTINKQDISSGSAQGTSFNKPNSSNMQNTNISYSGNSMNFSSMSTSTPVETAKYNGSNNNYLANLEIEGETLNTGFNKENTTYFIETSGKSELNVNVELDDSTAKAQVTGNTDLKTGENKILISVTAKNGDVRYYRVFVTII